MGELFEVDPAIQVSKGAYGKCFLLSNSALGEQWYRSEDGFVFVFSVTERETFDELPILYEKVRRAREQDNIPCVVVANKCDLRHKRAVSSREARAFARKLNCPFVETSAKTGVNVDVAFRQCARRVRNIDKVGSQHAGLTFVSLLIQFPSPEDIAIYSLAGLTVPRQARARFSYAPKFEFK